MKWMALVSLVLVIAWAGYAIGWMNNGRIDE